MSFTIPTILVAALLFGCVRAENNGDVSKLKFTVPSARVLAKGNATMNTEVLTHLVINITGPGVQLKPIQLDDECHSCNPRVGLTDTVSVSVPKGNDRLIQVLAVYQDTSTETMSLSYGDVTKNLMGDTEDVEIPVKALGAAQSIVSGRIHGRLFTSASGGPSGEVTIKYYPPGRPGLLLERSDIVNGWFSLFALRGADLRYELADGTVLFGGAVNIDSPIFAASNRVVRVTYPSYKREAEGGTSLRSEEPNIGVIGYFGDAAAIAAKRVCKDLSGSLQRSYRKDQTSTSGTKMLILESSNVPTTDALFTSVIPSIFVEGGETAANCSGLTEYSDKLMLRTTMMDDGGRDRLPSFAIPFTLLSTSLGYSAFAITNSGSNLAFAGKLLPGINNVVGLVRMYKTTSNTANFDRGGAGFPCDKLPAGYTDAGSGSVDSAGNFAFVSGATLADKATNNLNLGICFASPAGITYRHGGFIASYHFSQQGPPGNPATKLKLKLAPAASIGGCMMGSVEAVDANGESGSLSGSYTVTLTDPNPHGDSGVDDVQFFANSNCSGGVNSLDVTLDSFSPFKSFSYSLNESIATGEMEIRASTTGLTSDLVTPTVVNPGEMVNADFWGPAAISNVNKCKSVSFNARNIYNNNVSGEGGSATFTVTKGDGSAVTLSEAGLYTDSSCTTGGMVGGSLNIASGTTTLYFTSNTTGYYRISVSYTSAQSVPFSSMLMATVKAVGEATRFEITAGSGIDYRAGQCMNWDIKVYDDDANLRAHTGMVKLNGSLSSTPSFVDFFTDANCSSPLAGGVLNFTGETTKSFYARGGFASGSMATLYLSANSQGTGAYLQAPMISQSFDHSTLASNFGGGFIDKNDCFGVNIYFVGMSGVGTPLTNATGSPIGFVINYSGANYGSDYRIYTENTCTSEVTPERQLSIPVGQTSVTYYIKSVRAATSGDQAANLGIVPASFPNYMQTPSNMGSGVTFTDQP